MAVSLTLWQPLVDSLYVKQSPVQQAPGEAITYDLTVTNVGSGPDAADVIVTDLTRNGLVVTATVLSGAVTEAADVVTFTLTEMIRGHAYQAQISFDIGSETYMRYLKVLCR